MTHICVIRPQWVKVWTKWRTCCGQQFDIHFFEWNMLYFDSLFIKVCSQGFCQKWLSISSDDGMTLNRWNKPLSEPRMTKFNEEYAPFGLNSLFPKPLHFILHGKIVKAWYLGVDTIIASNVSELALITRLWRVRWYFGDHQVTISSVSASLLWERPQSWWRHQMETFSALLAICGGGEFSAQRPVTRSFDVFFDLCLNKRLRKQSRGWWFETLSRPLWRHCNDQVFSCGLFPVNDIGQYQIPGQKYCSGPNLRGGLN